MGKKKSNRLTPKRKVTESKLRQDVVEIENKYNYLRDHDFERFKSNFEFKALTKSFNIIPFLIIIVLLFVGSFFLFKYGKIGIALLLCFIALYSIVSFLESSVRVVINDKKVTIKNPFRKKEIDVSSIRKIYLTTSKKFNIGGFKAKIKFLTNTDKGDKIYLVDTMFVSVKDVEKFMSLIEVKKEENKEFIDETITSSLDLLFFVLIGLSIMVDLFLL